MACAVCREIFVSALWARNSRRDSTRLLALLQFRPATPARERSRFVISKRIAVWNGPVFRTGPLVRANARKQTKRPYSTCAEMCDFVGTVFEPYPPPPRRHGKTRCFRTPDPSWEGAHTPAHTPTPHPPSLSHSR